MPKMPLNPNHTIHSFSPKFGKTVKQRTSENQLKNKYLNCNHIKLRNS